jgi:hypothetical protein
VSAGDGVWADIMLEMRLRALKFIAKTNKNGAQLEARAEFADKITPLKKIKEQPQRTHPLLD